MMRALGGVGSGRWLLLADGVGGSCGWCRAQQGSEWSLGRRSPLEMIRAAGDTTAEDVGGRGGD